MLTLLHRTYCAKTGHRQAQRLGAGLGKLLLFLPSGCYVRPAGQMDEYARQLFEKSSRSHCQTTREPFSGEKEVSQAIWFP